MTEKQIVADLKDVMLVVRCGGCSSETGRPLTIDRTIRQLVPSSCPSCGATENLKTLVRVRLVESS
jgi:hypothetical protein